MTQFDSTVFHFTEGYRYCTHVLTRSMTYQTVRQYKYKSNSIVSRYRRALAQRTILYTLHIILYTQKAPVTTMMSPYLLAGTLLLMSSVDAFQASYGLLNRPCSILHNSNAGYSFPSSFTPQSSPQPPPSQQQDETTVAVVDDENDDDDDDDDDDDEQQSNTRFSKFAPDLNLDAADFRLQLRENMKADLERRRNADPNRGNQISKSYLDSL